MNVDIRVAAFSKMNLDTEKRILNKIAVKETSAV